METLKALAESDNPVDLFYNGDIAKKVVEEFKKNGMRRSTNQMISRMFQEPFSQQQISQTTVQWFMRETRS